MEFYNSFIVKYFVTNIYYYFEGELFNYIYNIYLIFDLETGLYRR